MHNMALLSDYQNKLYRTVQNLIPIAYFTNTPITVVSQHLPSNERNDIFLTWQEQWSQVYMLTGQYTSSGADAGQWVGLMALCENDDSQVYVEPNIVRRKSARLLEWGNFSWLISWVQNFSKPATCHNCRKSSDDWMSMSSSRKDASSNDVTSSFAFDAKSALNIHTEWALHKSHHFTGDTEIIKPGGKVCFQWVSKSWLHLSDL